MKGKKITIILVMIIMISGAGDICYGNDSNYILVENKISNNTDTENLGNSTIKENNHTNDIIKINPNTNEKSDNHKIIYGSLGGAILIAIWRFRKSFQNKK